jgi:pyrimidine deaminase RibD-like protein
MTESGGFSAADRGWMERAMELARRAEAEGEVPVGAVVANETGLLGEGWNRNISLSDPSAHAEILALREAGLRLNNYRLPGCVLYVTLEPCAMCVSAAIHARLDRLVWAVLTACRTSTPTITGCPGRADCSPIGRRTCCGHFFKLNAAGAGASLSRDNEDRSAKL